MNQNNRLLIIGNMYQTTNSLKNDLKPYNFLATITANQPAGKSFLKNQEYGAIIIAWSTKINENKKICLNIRKYNKQIPIIVITENPEMATEIDLLDNGADDYLVKPIFPSELAARIKAVERRTAPIMPPLIKLNDLIIDYQQKTVSKTSRLIKLTRQEFLILEYLATRRHAIVSREEIMEHVWNATADAFSKTIETHIYSLRKKIRKNKGRLIIKTFPGQGYRLVV